MKLFESARLKLTGWYLLIIMIISLFFSALVYKAFTDELGKGLRLHSLRLKSNGTVAEELQIKQAPLFELRRSWSPEEGAQTEIIIYDLVRKRLTLQLLFINVGIFGLAGAAGYFLAGKTLGPIEKMVDDQKRFIGDASHELRTPLTSLRTETEVSLRDPALTLKGAKNMLKSNLQEVEKMQELTTHLLNLSKYETDHKNFTLENFNAIELTEEAIKKIQPLAESKNIEIKQNVSNQKIKVNKTSFIELITILLDNAVKYSHPGTFVLLDIKKNRGQIHITVTDQGVGIKKSEIPHIFNRFYRADSSRCKTIIDGHGLGLSIAKSIVELHKGTIEVISKSGKGSTFKVVLPA